LSCRRLRLLGIRPLAALALALFTPACLDGPFVHANPLDARTPLTLTLLGGRDTLGIVGEQALFQLVTDPVTSGFTVSWRSSSTALLAPRGLGRFEVVSLPGFASTVEITATLGTRSVTRTVVILPAS